MSAVIISHEYCEMASCATQHKQKESLQHGELLGPGSSGSRDSLIPLSKACWATPRAHAVRARLRRRSTLQGKDCIGNRWVLAIPRLLLLELLVNNVLLTMDSGAAAMVLTLPDDADLLFGVALVLARREVGSSTNRSRVVGVGRVVATAFPPRPVQVRQMDVHLLVLRGCNRLLLLDVTVRRREDAEGNGDSCFKIQLDCLCGCAQSGLFLDLLLRPDDRREAVKGSVRERKKKRFPLASSWGKEVERKERKRRTLPIRWDSFCLFWTLTFRSRRG